MKRSPSGFRVGMLALVIAMLAVGATGVAVARQVLTRGPAGVRFYQPPARSPPVLTAR